MKFTKEDAHKELVKQMTAKGEKLNLSERSINEQLDTLMTLVANDETELADFVEKTLPIFKTADANIRNDVSFGINEYKRVNPPANPQKKDDGDNKGMSELEAKIEEMQRKLDEADRVARVRETRTNILSKLKEKGVDDSDWAKSLLDEITITEDFNVDEKVDSFVKLYNKSKSQYDDGSTPKRTSSGKNDYFSDVIEQAAKMNKSQNLLVGEQKE